MTYKSNKDMLKRQEFIMISEHHNIFTWVWGRNPNQGLLLVSNTKLSK